MAIFELGSLICALANSSKMVIAGRAVTGIGGSGIFNGTLVIMTATAAPEIRPILIGCGVSMISIGGILGPIIGGALTEHVSWRWCEFIGNAFILQLRNCLIFFIGFYVFLPPGGLTMAVMLILHIPEQTTKPQAKSILRQLPQKLDLIGFALFAPPCIMFLIAISWGGINYPWKSATVIGLILGSAGIFAVFVVWSIWRGDDGLIPLSLIRQRTVLIGSCVSGLQGGASIMVTYYLPLWFQSIKEASPTNSGLMMLPTMISQIVGSLISAALGECPLYRLVSN